MTEHVVPRWTPLVFSDILSAKLGYGIYLKLENLQPPQSFKFRSLTLYAQEAQKIHGPSVHLVIASSGNAAFALSHAAHAYGIANTVFVTLDAGKSKSVIDMMLRLGSNVRIGGADYPDALKKAQAFVRENPNTIMVPSYDHPTLWRGVSSIVNEISQQLPEHHPKPEAILCSVGGGSLIGGIMLGCKEAGWDDVRLISLETRGADCFYQSLRGNPIRRYISPSAALSDRRTTMPLDIKTHVDSNYGVTLATLPAITSRAASLGALSPSAGVVKAALDRAGFVSNVSVPDELSMQAALNFADDHKMIVELACSTTLTPAYCPPLFERLFGKPETIASEQSKRKALVFIVCGGYKASVAQLLEFDAHLKQAAEESIQREAEVDGYIATI